MADPSISFGDNIRVKTTPETASVALAGLTGEVYRHTTPSVTDVDVIGPVTEDFAINVHFDERGEAFWFAPELLEFVDHDAGTEITLDGVDKKWTRNTDGGWDQSSTDNEPACKVECRLSLWNDVFVAGCVTPMIEWSTVSQ